MTDDERATFVRVGRNVYGYGGIACHPGAIVRYRDDLLNNEKMRKYGGLSEPFEKSLSELSLCSDEHCAGVYMLVSVPTDWEGHLRYAHGGSPTSRSAQLRVAHAAKIAAYDQAAEAEREAREQREALETEVQSIKEQLAAIETPEQLPAVPTGKPSASARKKMGVTN